MFFNWTGEWTAAEGFEIIPRHDPYHDVLSALARLGNHAEPVSTARIARTPLGRRLEAALRRREKLRFVLPAFPAKSPSREKTSGPLPDLGELLALGRLQTFCEEIAAVHGPGAEVLICSDGRVFNDLVLVPDEDLRAYQTAIAGIIAEKDFHHLRTYSLDDVWPDETDFARLRGLLVDRYAPSTVEIETRVRDGELRPLFNGIHRFLLEDRRALFPGLSRSALVKDAKTAAYQVMRRSAAWDRLLEDRFSGTLRLSIHPYPLEHAKFGVRLVAGHDRWGTPWHNVTVLRDGEFVLMKRAEALAEGAREELFEGRYVFYRL